jgi:3-isopropylmalate/(R)-2-methylmalate dehydratase small subunit
MFMERIRGKAFAFRRDDIDTDMIIPAKYLNTDDPRELAGKAMEFLDPDFPGKVKKTGTKILVAGRNFGCGSSREHAVWCLTGLGIKAVIAESFARIFFRNCVNYGLFPAALPGAAGKISTGDDVEIDPEKGTVKNITKGREYQTRPLPGFAMDIVKAGGLLNHVRKSMEAGK